MKVTIRRELFSASLFCHSIVLNSISVGKPWNQETQAGTHALSLTGHVTIKETRDKSSLEPVFLATRE